MPVERWKCRKCDREATCVDVNLEVRYLGVFCACGSEVRNGEAIKMEMDEKDFLYLSSLWDLPDRGPEGGNWWCFPRPVEEPQRVKEYPFYLEEDYGLEGLMI